MSKTIWMCQQGHVNGSRWEKGVLLTAIHLLAGTRGVGAFLETDKGKALGALRLSIPGQEDARDAAEALEHASQVVFLGELAHLRCPED